MATGNHNFRAHMPRSISRPCDLHLNFERTEMHPMHPYHVHAPSADNIDCRILFKSVRALHSWPFANRRAIHARVIEFEGCYKRELELQSVKG